MKLAEQYLKMGETKLSTTEQKLLDQLKDFSQIVNLDKSRLVKAVRRLESLGMVTVKEEENDYGHKWLKVNLKEVSSSVSDSDLETVADILTNDENSSDNEMIDNIIENTSLTKEQASKIVKAERRNYLSGKYLSYWTTDDVKLLRKYV